MKELDQMWECLKKEEGVLLATSAGKSVTMRTISPVCHQDAVLMFTHPESVKYKQMKENPFCCIAAGGCFLEAKAEFLGPTMSDTNAALRDVYAQKFPDAFDENVPFGGRTSEFVLMRPVRVKGWAFENGVPAAPIDHEF